ncbi:MAG: glycosyltransferase family 87 protein, partial [Bacteroidales bacterium]
MLPGKIRTSLVKLFTNPTFLIALWLGVTLICCLMKYGKYPPRYNNFIIFTHSFLHALEQLPLYIEYPAEHHDVFLYGILFTPLIAPFAVFTPFIGMIVWCLANTLLLYFAIKKLGLEKWQFAFVICLSVNDLFLAVTQQQYNVGICGMIILSYFLINQKKEFWAACMIMLGAMTKVYGIVGLAFFFFAKRPLVLIGGLIFWGIFFFILPMSFTSPQYVIGEYVNWLDALISKNALNMFTDYTNISLIGMIHKISWNLTFSDLWIFLPGLTFFIAP